MFNSKQVLVTVWPKVSIVLVLILEIVIVTMSSIAGDSTDKFFLLTSTAGLEKFYFHYSIGIQKR